MHDWHLANEILKTVLEHANKDGFKSVSMVRIELGSLVEHGEEISPENLIHNFKLLSEKTIAKDTKLEIKKVTCLPASQRGEPAGRKENNWKLLDIEGQ